MGHRSTTRTYTCAMVVRCLNADARQVFVPTTLRFDPADPVAVTMVITVGTDENVTWTFARQLLRAGEHRPAGIGDVRVSPVHHNHGTFLAVRLSSPSGHATLELPRANVHAFINRTYRLVPASDETAAMDLDTELAALLRSGAA